MVCAPVVVEIEVHTAEEHHQFHTRYNLDKYKALAQQLQHLLGQRLHEEGIDHSVVLNPELKGGWKPYFFVPNYYIKADKSRKFYPRLGAFEVTVRCGEDFRSGTGLPSCVELWSKLRTRRWPKPDRLVEDLTSLLVAGRQGDETNSILRRIKGKLEEAEKLRCDSPATTASSLNLAKPPAGPIAVSLRGRSRPDSAPPSRARPESAPPASDDAKASAPRRLKPLPRTSSVSKPPLARPPSTSRPASARAPATSRPASARAPRQSRPTSARSEHVGSAKEGPPEAEDPATAPQAPPPVAAEEEAAPQAAEEQLAEACQLADLLSGPAEVTQAAGQVAQQEPPSITEAQPVATPSPSPKPGGRGSYEDEDFEESEGGASPKVTSPSPLQLTAAETLPGGTDRFGSQQDQAEDFEAEFEEPIKGKADLSAESTDIDEALRAGAGERCKKSLTAGGASSASGSTRGTVTPVDTTAALTTATGSFKDALQARLSQSHRLSDESSGTSGSNLPSPAQRGGGGDTARTALPPKLLEAPADDPYEDFEDDFEEDPPSAPALDPAPGAAPPGEAAAAAPPAAATLVAALPAAASPSATVRPPAEPTPPTQPVAEDPSAVDPPPAAAPAAQTPPAAAQPRPDSAGPAVGLATAAVDGEAKAAAADRSQTFEDPYDEGFEQTLTDEPAGAATGPSAAQEPPQQEERRPQQQTLLPAAVAAATVQEQPAAAAPADPGDASKDPYDETFEQTLRDEPGGVEKPEKETREAPEPAVVEPAAAPAAAAAEEPCEAPTPATVEPAATPVAAAAEETVEGPAPAADEPAAAPAAAAAEEPASPKKALERQPSLGVTGDYDSDFEDD